MIVLRASNLSAGYSPDRRIVSDIDLELERGQVLALLGPNGAGKTTLLRALIDLLPVCDGRIDILGIPRASRPARWRAQKIGYVPQREDQDPAMTVYDATLIGRAPHRGWMMPWTRDDLDAVERALRRLDIWDLRLRQLGELSGGERQRVALARALAQSPDILLLDEPVAHLDPGHQVALFGVLRELAATGTAVLMTLHDLNQALQWSDRAVLLDEGRVVATGAPVDVLTPECIGAVYGVRATVGAIDGVPVIRYTSG